MKYKEGFVWEIENKEVAFEDLQVGDSVVIFIFEDDEWYEGVVLKFGKTILHNHPYIKIQGFEFDKDYGAYPEKIKFYKDEIKKIKRIAKVKYINLK